MSVIPHFSLEFSYIIFSLLCNLNIIVLVISIHLQRTNARSSRWDFARNDNIKYLKDYSRVAHLFEQTPPKPIGARVLQCIIS